MEMRNVKAKSVPEVKKHTIENLTIRSNEAVCVGNNELQQLVWAEVGPTMSKALQYEILAKNSNRDWLISISGSFKKH